MWWRLWGTGSKTLSQTEPPYLHDHLATVGLDHIHVLWLEDVRLLVVYCQLLTSVKLMEVPVKNWICINHYICWITNTRHTVVEISLLYFVLLFYSQKSWQIFKTRVSLKICWFWQFQNTPYMCNLTNFWLRYLQLKTQDTILLFFEI